MTPGPCPNPDTPNFPTSQVRTPRASSTPSFLPTATQHRGFTFKMAAVVKAINSKIRAHPVLNYVCSTRESALLFSYGIPCPSSSSPSAIGHSPTMPDTAPEAAILEATLGSDSPFAWGEGRGMLPGPANCPFKLPPPHVAVACPQLCLKEKHLPPGPSPLTPPPSRLLGPRLQLRHPPRRRRRHPKEPRAVRPPPLPPLPGRH